MEDFRTLKAIRSVVNERSNQNKKWGVQRHDFPLWMTILGEEYGEACQALLKSREYELHNTDVLNNEEFDNFRQELVQIAAVTTAIIEHIDEIKEKYE